MTNQTNPQTEPEPRPFAEILADISNARAEVADSFEQLETAAGDAASAAEEQAEKSTELQNLAELAREVRRNVAIVARLCGELAKGDGEQIEPMTEQLDTLKQAREELAAAEPNDDALLGEAAGCNVAQALEAAEEIENLACELQQAWLNGQGASAQPETEPETAPSQPTQPETKAAPIARIGPRTTLHEAVEALQARRGELAALEPKPERLAELIDQAETFELFALSARDLETQANRALQLAEPDPTFARVQRLRDLAAELGRVAESFENLEAPLDEPEAEPATLAVIAASQAALELSQLHKGWARELDAQRKRESAAAQPAPIEPKPTDEEAAFALAFDAASVWVARLERLAAQPEPTDAAASAAARDAAELAKESAAKILDANNPMEETLQARRAELLRRLEVAGDSDGFYRLGLEAARADSRARLGHLVLSLTASQVLAAVESVAKGRAEFESDKFARQLRAEVSELAALGGEVDAGELVRVALAEAARQDAEAD